jgi:hypothetical protein
MEQLPYIDEHCQRVCASPEAAWAGVLEVVHRVMSGSTRFARVLGCEPADATPRFAGRVGDTVPGFRVVDAEPNRRLVLRGKHSFSRYQLTFQLDGDELRAEFPGMLGRLYRAAVIGSHGHELITRRMLRQMARAGARAESGR